MKRLESNPEAVQRIGRPMANGFPAGKFRITRKDGRAEITFSVEGPSGEGTVQLDAIKGRGSGHSTIWCCGRKGRSEKSI